MILSLEAKRHYYDWHGADIATIGELRQELQNCESVLDLGCGSGWLCIELAKMGIKEVVGVDIDVAVNALNVKGMSSTRGIQSSTDSLPLESSTFDLVIAKDLIEHLAHPALTLQEAFRVLKPGGRIYIATPSPKSRSFYDDYTHVRPFTRKALSSLLEDCGLDVERVFYTGNYPGVGRYMRLRGRERLPRICYILAGSGVGRNNVHAWAQKPAITTPSIWNVTNGAENTF